MRRAILIGCAVFLIAGMVSTPVSCQYLQRNGPDWVKPVEKDTGWRSASDDGFEFSVGLLTFALAAGAAACIAKAIDD